jgi:hypothetical protein
LPDQFTDALHFRLKIFLLEGRHLLIFSFS